MELANGKVNQFFTPPGEGENRYYIENFEAAKENSNVFTLCQQVPENATVLDVGCAQGRFGPELKKKGCTIYGIDADAQAVSYAKKTGCYTDIFLMDMTREDTDEYCRFSSRMEKEQLDVIIFSDVFEHLADPTSILLQYSRFLKTEGMILVSVPNVAHMDIALHLINGEFNYTDMGILDNTHLKFFTKSSFAQWIDQINKVFPDSKFDCEYLGSTVYENAFVNRLKEEYTELYSILSNYENFNSLQILFKLKKLSAEKAASNLNDLLLKKEKGNLQLLGKVLSSIRVLENSLEWYKQQETERKTSDKKRSAYISALEESLNWYKKHEEDRKIADKGQNDYVKQLEGSLEWYKKHEEERKTADERQSDYVKQLEESLEWYKKHEEEMQSLIYKKDSTINNLQKQILKIENSFSWKLGKFFRKK